LEKDKEDKKEISWTEPTDFKLKKQVSIEELLFWFTW